MSNIKTLTTSKLIHSIKLRSAIPETDNTFTQEDFLYFINEEMDLGVVPHIQSFHEDYFLYSEFIDLVSGQDRYTIPNRAVGVKLRDVSFFDGSGFYEMTRISVEDLSDKYVNFQTYNFKAFYVEGDEIVIPQTLNVGQLKVSYYMRPNALVSDDDVAAVTKINKFNGLVTVDKYPDKFNNITTFDITSSKSSFRLIAKDYSPEGVATTDNLNFTFGTIRQCNYTLPLFSLITASSYISVIDNSQGLNEKHVFWFDLTGSNVAPVVPNASIHRVDISTATTNTQVIVALISVFASTFINNNLLMQQLNADSFSIQNGGVGISVGNNFSVSSSGFTLVEVVISEGTVTLPKKLNINDVISLPEETNIPQIPIEVHAMLAQRAAMRCLESLGDAAGLQAAAAKLADMEAKTGTLLNDRVESAPLKIVPRHTPIKRSLQRNYRSR